MSNYWQNRQEEVFLNAEKITNTYYKKLERSFEQAKKETQLVINEFYMKYAKENGLVRFSDAQLLLSRTEIAGLKTFIQRVNDTMGEYDLELTNMSIKARITRYQALEKQIDAILQRLYSIDYESEAKKALEEVYKDSYYRTWYNFDLYNGFHAEFAQISPRDIDALIKYPFNGANFSTRLWKQKDFLEQKLMEDLTTIMVRGVNPRMLSREFAKHFDRRQYEAYRLLHTESAFISEQATLQGYREEGIKKYQILATLDHKTSEICKGEDGEKYDVDKAVVGDNYPPFHIFCRTTTVPYYEDGEVTTRVARGIDGKTYTVPSDMNYSEWKHKYVD